MNKNIDTLKAELKQLAEQIHIAKQERKTVRFTGERTIKSKFSWQSDATAAKFLALNLKDEFRHKHIAYCQLRGTPRDLIEPKVKDGNEPNETLISQLVYEYYNQPEEEMEVAV